MENIDSKNDCLRVSDTERNIPIKLEHTVKPEPHDCLLCAVVTEDNYDIHITILEVSRKSLLEFLSKFTLTDLSNNSKYLCKSCFNIINVLEHAEQEYLKLKQVFDDILKRNPLFQNPPVIKTVKVENKEVTDNVDYDSDEPLSITKKKRYRKVDKRKKKTNTISKAKTKSKNNDKSWETTDQDTTEGAELHIKSENADGPPQYNNGIASALGNIIKTELLDFDYDMENSSDYVPDHMSDSEESLFDAQIKVSKSSKPQTTKTTKRKKAVGKKVYKCDDCQAVYTSLGRLKRHREKHDQAPKQPFICEICGAHYKHKKACDIHVALHKGISDWKCEECNKLFPSKGALQRHNNIHTGKANYQCDLCGKSFIHTSSFKMHKLAHSGLKPHTCRTCGLALMTRSHLKRHERIHSGEKRHECTVCGKRFSERYNLVAHSKSHETVEREPNNAPAEPKRYSFRCHFCQERFVRRYMLERHMAKEHGRALERPPPTPRNTMSKLLKAQAHSASSAHADVDTKEEVSSEPRGTPVPNEKLLAVSSGNSPSDTWSSSYQSQFRNFTH